ncbi:MAG: DCC1-like thiol-disulfide oxidoreductase family protein [Leptolyngbyaceae cyanobacterium MO_188.B28]|nr:DCC1-like thiol-disulfide oxidoreductase family protein [Leptolyngbyaceae cyanobacterium MO_188.B28]
MEDLKQAERLELSRSPKANAIVFFDGECLLCNSFVDFILRIDKANVLQIATLQGYTAQERLPALPEQIEEWSIYYIEAEEIYDQSDAVLRVLYRLGGIWHWLSFARIVPRRIRNFVYKIIARNRYRWFGRRATCRMPSEQDKARFLP